MCFLTLMLVDFNCQLRTWDQNLESHLTLSGDLSAKSRT